MGASTQHGAITGDAADWLNRFAEAVRDNDTERGRAMFDPDALGFGSWTVAAEGLDALEHEQWRNVWHRLSGPGR